MLRQIGQTRGGQRFPAAFDRNTVDELPAMAIVNPPKFPRPAKMEPQGFLAGPFLINIISAIQTTVTGVKFHHPPAAATALEDLSMGLGHNHNWTQSQLGARGAMGGFNDSQFFHHNFDHIILFSNKGFGFPNILCDAYRNHAIRHSIKLFQAT